MQDFSCIASLRKTLWEQKWLLHYGEMSGNIAISEVTTLYNDYHKLINKKRQAYLLIF
jgi:hypothetical protein